MTINYPLPPDLIYSHNSNILKKYRFDDGDEPRNQPGPAVPHVQVTHPLLDRPPHTVPAARARMDKRWSAGELGDGRNPDNWSGTIRGDAIGQGSSSSRGDMGHNNRAQRGGPSDKRSADSPYIVGGVSSNGAGSSAKAKTGKRATINHEKIAGDARGGETRGTTQTTPFLPEGVPHPIFSPARDFFGAGQNATGSSSHYHSSEQPARPASGLSRGPLRPATRSAAQGTKPDHAHVDSGDDSDLEEVVHEDWVRATGQPPTLDAADTRAPRASATGSKSARGKDAFGGFGKHRMSTSPSKGQVKGRKPIVTPLIADSNATSDARPSSNAGEDSIVAMDRPQRAGPSSKTPPSRASREQSVIELDDDGEEVERESERGRSRRSSARGGSARPSVEPSTKGQRGRKGGKVDQPIGLTKAEKDNPKRSARGGKAGAGRVPDDDYQPSAARAKGKSRANDIPSSALGHPSTIQGEIAESYLFEGAHIAAGSATGFSLKVVLSKKGKEVKISIIGGPGKEGLVHLTGDDIGSMEWCEETDLPVVRMTFKNNCLDKINDNFFHANFRVQHNTSFFLLFDQRQEADPHGGGKLVNSIKAHFLSSKQYDKGAAQAVVDLMRRSTGGSRAATRQARRSGASASGDRETGAGGKRRVKRKNEDSSALDREAMVEVSDDELEIDADEGAAPTPAPSKRPRQSGSRKKEEKEDDPKQSKLSLYVNNTARGVASAARAILEPLVDPIRGLLTRSTTKGESRDNAAYRDRAPRTRDQDQPDASASAGPTRVSARQNTRSKAYQEPDEDDDFNLTDTPGADAPVITEPRPSDPETILFSYPKEKPTLSVTRGDRFRVKAGDYLNDTLIEFGLKSTMLDAIDAKDLDVSKDVHLFNTFFYGKISAPKPRHGEADEHSWAAYNSVRRWTKSFDVFEKKLIIVPICENNHWYLAVIYNPAGVLREKQVEAKVDDKADMAEEARVATAQAPSSPVLSPSTVAQVGRNGAKNGEDAGEVDALDDSGEAAPRRSTRLSGDGVQPDPSETSEEEEEHVEEPREGALDQDVLAPDADQGGGSEAAAEDGGPASDVDMEADEDLEVEHGRAAEPRASNPALDRLQASQGDVGDASTDSVDPLDCLTQGEDAEEDEPAFAEDVASFVRASNGKGSGRVSGESGMADAGVNAEDMDVDSPAMEDAESDSSMDIDEDEGKENVAVPVVRAGSSPRPLTPPRDLPAVAPPIPPAAVEAKPMSMIHQQFMTQGRAPAPSTNDDSAVPAKTEVKPAPAAAKEEAAPSKRAPRDILDSDDAWILTFDSLGGAHKPVERVLSKWLLFEARDKKGVTYEMTSAKYCEAKQSNFSDCGLYLIHFARQLLLDHRHVIRFIEKQTPLAQAEKSAWQTEMNTIWATADTSDLRAHWTGIIDSLDDVTPRTTSAAAAAAETEAASTANESKAAANKDVQVADADAQGPRGPEGPQGPGRTHPLPPRPPPASTPGPSRGVGGFVGGAGPPTSAHRMIYGYDGVESSSPLTTGTPFDLGRSGAPHSPALRTYAQSASQTALTPPTNERRPIPAKPRVGPHTPTLSTAPMRGASGGVGYVDSRVSHNQMTADTLPVGSSADTPDTPPLPSPTIGSRDIDTRPVPQHVRFDEHGKPIDDGTRDGHDDIEYVDLMPKMHAPPGMTEPGAEKRQPRIRRPRRPEEEVDVAVAGPSRPPLAPHADVSAMLALDDEVGGQFASTTSPPASARARQRDEYSQPSPVPSPRTLDALFDAPQGSSPVHEHEHVEPSFSTVQSRQAYRAPSPPLAGSLLDQQTVGALRTWDDVSMTGQHAGHARRGTSGWPGSSDMDPGPLSQQELDTSRYLGVVGDSTPVYPQSSSSSGAGGQLVHSLGYASAATASFADMMSSSSLPGFRHPAPSNSGAPAAHVSAISASQIQEPNFDQTGGGSNPLKARLGPGSHGHGVSRRKGGREIGAGGPEPVYEVANGSEEGDQTFLLDRAGIEVYHDDADESRHAAQRAPRGHHAAAEHLATAAASAISNVRRAAGATSVDEIRRRTEQEGHAHAESVPALVCYSSDSEDDAGPVAGSSGSGDGGSPARVLIVRGHAGLRGNGALEQPQSAPAAAGNVSPSKKRKNKFVPPRPTRPQNDTHELAPAGQRPTSPPAADTAHKIADDLESLTGSNGRADSVQGDELADLAREELGEGGMGGMMVVPTDDESTFLDARPGGMSTRSRSQSKSKSPVKRSEERAPRSLLNAALQGVQAQDQGKGLPSQGQGSGSGSGAGPSGRGAGSGHGSGSGSGSGSGHGAPSRRKAAPRSASDQARSDVRADAADRRLQGQSASRAIDVDEEGDGEDGGGGVNGGANVGDGHGQGYGPRHGPAQATWLLSGNGGNGGGGGGAAAAAGFAGGLGDSPASRPVTTYSVKRGHGRKRPS